ESTKIAGAAATTTAKTAARTTSRATRRRFGSSCSVPHLEVRPKEERFSALTREHKGNGRPFVWG
ncbi:MAG TPA: hypothetical protein VJP08_00250, partial [Actinomycetota bacterium]|nr:hypothetical protein [Actinomycetota bacterium]